MASISVQSGDHWNKTIAKCQVPTGRQEWICAMPDETGQKQAETKFKPGQSGNPKGRPAGSRNKLGEEFIEALQADFKNHGKDAIIKVRTEKPDQYLKVIASIVPKDLNVNVNNFDGLSDDELRSELRDLAATLAAFVGDAAGESDHEGTGAPQTH